MKKIAPKSGVKNIIKKIVDDALTKIFDVTKENGYKISLDRSWNVINDGDLESYDSAEKMLAENESFATKDYDSMIAITDDLNYHRLTLVSDAEIESLSKRFLAKKAALEMKKKHENAEQIEKLQKQIAAAQRKLDRLMAE